MTVLRLFKCVCICRLLSSLNLPRFICVSLGSSSFFIFTAIWYVFHYVTIIRSLLVILVVSNYLLIKQYCREYACICLLRRMCKISFRAVVLDHISHFYRNILQLPQYFSKMKFILISLNSCFRESNAPTKI